MHHFVFRSPLVRFIAVSALALCSGVASAAVTQPDGTVMPLDPNNGEITLQELFDFREGEGAIDAFTDASTEPATFRPLCNFSAQLLLHETGSNSAMGWYNVPADDTPPNTVCDEDTGLNNLGDPCSAADIFVLVPGDVATPQRSWEQDADPLNNPGEIFMGEDLASHEHYAGGAIGFVLLTGQKHYSELRLNPECVEVGAGGAAGAPSNCAEGDRWIPTIMYASVAEPQSFYMCSEDQTVGPSEWGGNDGDFNDFVFVFTGLVCTGSGEACDTGEPGICAAGLTDCADADGNSECRPARMAEDETCNALDDDCDGEVDDGDLCPADEICVRGRCFPLCGTGEFRCPADYTCVEGACVEDACVGVECEAGEVCQGGDCVGACDDVVCPHGQECRDGACVDPCAGIECPEGLVCSGGACVVECTCAGCEQGECDDGTGQCVDGGCAGVTCDPGTHCAAGACVDDCEGAVCPGGAACSEGVCGTPLDGAGGEAGGTGSGGTIVIGTGGSSATGSGATSAAGGTTGSGADGGAGPGQREVEDAGGCGCRVVPGGARGTAALSALLLAGLLLVRRRGRAV